MENRQTQNPIFLFSSSLHALIQKKPSLSHVRWIYLRENIWLISMSLTKKYLKICYTPCQEDKEQVQTTLLQHRFFCLSVVISQEEKRLPGTERGWVPSTPVFQGGRERGSVDFGSVNSNAAGKNLIFAKSAVLALECNEHTSCLCWNLFRLF